MAAARWVGWLVPLLVSSTIAPAAAQDTGEAIARRTRELLPILDGDSAPEAIFTPRFRADIPESQLQEVAQSVRAQLGRATGYRSVTIREAGRAELVIAYERGTAHGGLVVEAGRSGRIAAFWIAAVEPADISALETLDDVAARFAAFPGAAGFVVADTAQGKPQAAHEAERPLAIGSAFKLVILAELVRAVEHGGRRWEDRVALGPRELPAGEFRGLAPSTRVSLRKLAEAMIRTSDNSATDVLLHELGREQVEAMQAALGWRHAAANTPFLSTVEAFKLKGVDGGQLGRRYLAADTAGRRRLLETEVAPRTGPEVGALFADGRPVMIESLEWFASASDLVRAMNWFAERANRPAGAEALRLLALNPGPAASVRERFGYVGYKGGSEPGVVNMTVLVRGRSGRWSVIAATWNNPAAPVDEGRFAALVTRALTLVAAQ